MVMRSRVGNGAAAPSRGARSGVIPQVYEEFRPMSDWQQDDEFHILNISLPGFMKEQIRVSTEGRNTIKVRGERLVAGNKWDRFLEDFQVPENGEMNSVRVKLQGGVLSISVPKVTVEVLTPKAEGADNIKRQPTPEKGQEKVSSEVNTSKGTEPPKSSSDTRTKRDQDGDQKQFTPQMGQDKAIPAVDTRQSTNEPEKTSGDPNKEHDQKALSTMLSTEEKSLEPLKTLVDPKKEHDRHGDQRGTSFTPLTRTIVSHTTEKRQSSESKEKHNALERPDDVRKKTVDKEGKEIIGSKELPDAPNKIKLEKDGATHIPEKNAESKELYGAFTKEKYKKALKGLAELSEERQLLMNMGVAMLVIVALTAYTTYNFASAKDRN